MSNYLRAYPYEIFIRVAFTCERGDAHGASAYFMQKLLDAEKEQAQNAPQHLEAVKGYLDAALDQFIQQDLSTDEKLDLMAMKHQVRLSKTGDELCEIVGQALLITGKLLR